MDFFSNMFLISSIHGGFLIAVLIIQNRWRFNENSFLILLLLIVTGYVFREYLYTKDHFETFPHLMAFFVPWLYLIGPLYYFYVRSSIDQVVTISRKDLLHLIPALVCFFIILPFYIKSGEEKLALYSAPTPDNLELASNRIFFYGFMLISWFFYAWMSLSLIRNKLSVVDNRTLKSLKSRLVWLKKYTSVFIVFLFLFLTAQLIFVLSDFYPYYVMLSTILSGTLLIHFVGYWALKESSITNSSSNNSESNKLSSEKREVLKNQLIHLLEKDRIYLKSDLSILELSELLSVNTKYISQLVNDDFNCSLTHLINSYRISTSQEMILSDDYDHLNFLGIANQVGFNTKNTFTRAFKRHTGMTPSEFKLSHSKK